MKQKQLIISIVGLCLVLLLTRDALAEYVIDIDDALQVTFWQQASLNQSVVVNSDGKITLSVIGDITAAGLTPPDLSRKIVEQVSRFNRDISQATVVVVAYNSQTVFVEGEVVSPGRFAREVIPDLWTIIKEMGGVTQFGDLRNIKVIRGGTEEPGKVIAVDVLNAVSNRDFSSLPKISPHDIIQVPRTISGTPTTGINAENTSARNVYYVLGAVARPGAYTLESGLGLLEALSLAGGATATANLKSVYISSKSGDYANVYSINLDKQMKKGTPQRYILQPEDAILIPDGGGGVLGIGAAVLSNFASFSSTITSTILLIDRLRTGR
jgi:polysaccharide export outer membrane protein